MFLAFDPNAFTIEPKPLKNHINTTRNIYWRKYSKTWNCMGLFFQSMQLKNSVTKVNPYSLRSIFFVICCCSVLWRSSLPTIPLTWILGNAFCNKSQNPCKAGTLCMLIYEIRNGLNSLCILSFFPPYSMDYFRRTLMAKTWHRIRNKFFF